MPLSMRQQLALKLKLERVFTPKLVVVLDAMVSDFKKVVTNTGSAPSTKRFIKVWNALLNDHYKVVQEEFNGVSTGKSFKEESEEDNEALLVLALKAWRDQNVDEQTTLILETSEDNMVDALSSTREALTEEGETFNNAELAIAAAIALSKKYIGRVPVIAITETQMAAESTKLIEAEIDADIEPYIFGAAVVSVGITKAWWAIIDKRTRAWHAKANGQLVKINEPFRVANGKGKIEQLMFPGDTSLGASSDNIVACRCGTKY